MRVLRLVTVALALLLARDAHGESDRVKSGTGFFVTRDGFLLTSAHVVDGCGKMSVWQPNGTERPSYVVGFDRQRDIALLWADGMSPRPVAVASRVPPREGDEVFTLGYGVDTKNPLTPALVEGSYVGDRTAQPGNHIIVIRARLRAGNSGGAVLAGDGSLLGMVVGRDEDHPEFGVAVPRDDLEALLTVYGILLPVQESQPTAPGVLGAISVLIQCSAQPAAKKAPAVSGRDLSREVPERAGRN